MSEKRTGHVRIDRANNTYAIPSDEVEEFDYECDTAVMAESDEAIGLWIDIKTKWKKYKV